MTKPDLQFKLRLPASLKEQLEKAAKRGDKSLTSEIVSRLEASFHDSPAIVELRSALEAAANEAQYNAERHDLLGDMHSILQKLVGHEIAERIRLARDFSKFIREIHAGEKIPQKQTVELLARSERASQMPSKDFLKASPDTLRVLERVLGMLEENSDTK